MAYIQTYQLSRATKNRSFLDWSSALDTDISYTYKNGSILYGPIIIEAVDRSIDIGHEDTETVQAETHDFTDLETTPNSIYETPDSIPKIRWNRLESAIEYNLYHKETVGGVESLVLTVAQQEKEVIEVNFPFRLTGCVWHFIRVESVDTYGNVSTRLSWLIFPHDLPSPIDYISIENGSGAGLFNIEITE